MRCLDSKDPRDQELFVDAPKMVDHLSEESHDHFEEVKRGLTKLGVAFELDPKLVRGLDYYTKTAFEVKCQTLDGAIKTIGGGGRYDGLVEQLGGTPTPGIGFGSGIERVLLALESQGINAPAAAPSRVLVAYMDSGVKYEAMAIAEGLRRQDIRTEFMYTAKNLGRQLNEAGDKNVDYVVIVGGTEWDNGEVTLKNFQTREQERVPAGEAVERLVARIRG
jgi:histidyl-tRNA synthetase